LPFAGIPGGRIGEAGLSLFTPPWRKLAGAREKTYFPAEWAFEGQTGGQYSKLPGHERSKATEIYTPGWAKVKSPVEDLDF